MWLRISNFKRESKATSYGTDEIEDILTGLSGQFLVSPKFKDVLAQTKIKLTGLRKKDYILAEEKTGMIHIPKKTVWHHVWEKDIYGNYTMQLVDFELHRKTCPHAGGVKLWLLNNSKMHSYKSRLISPGSIYVNEYLKNKKTIVGTTITKTGLLHASNDAMYEDYVIDAIVLEDEVSRPHNIRKNSRKFKSGWRKWGYDPYGNTFLIDAKKQLYF